MDNSMNKRVYGILGVSSIMANWNADFSGYPKTTSDGTTFGSDKALKYPMKKMWNNEGKPVIYIKTLRFEEGKKNDVSLIPRSLKERYEQLFNIKDLKECKDNKEVLSNLFQAVDVKNFGATFAESGNNFSITGAVQFGQGFNMYDKSEAQEHPILSPFRDGTKTKEDGSEAKNSTLGTKIVSDEAHYFYPFVVNPLAYKEFISLGVTEGYTQEDYDTFKNTALVAVTAYATNAKEGCENEFALFIETEENLYLPNLTEYISFNKHEQKNSIDMQQCMKILNEVKDKIHSIEIYYNPFTTELIGNMGGTTIYNILTQKVI